MSFKDFSTIEKIDYTARNVIVLSYIYYNLNYNVVEDKVYDDRLKYLCKLVDANRDIISQSPYYDAIKDIDPSTGFDLYYKLNDKEKEKIERIADLVVKMHKLDNVKYKK